MDDDIVLEYPLFDSCVEILTNLSQLIQNVASTTTSSGTYALHLVISDALHELPSCVVQNELITILERYGWDTSTRQFLTILQTTDVLVSEIETLADRLLAN